MSLYSSDCPNNMERHIYSMILMALFGHCVSHALQIRHSSTFTATDLPSFISNTPTGHTSRQVSHPSHLSRSILISTNRSHIRVKFQEAPFLIRDVNAKGGVNRLTVLVIVPGTTPNSLTSSLVLAAPFFS